jgi:ABC-2 type transport system ATP-binding protein
MIETTDLRKTFSYRVRRTTTKVEAVRGVDLGVAEGEIFGFLGPNGAGKTTTLRMLTTLLLPDAGTATIAGVDLRAEPARVRGLIGYVAQGGGASHEATAREDLVMQARLQRIPKSEAVVRAARAVEVFQLTEFADRPGKTCSGGQRRRTDIALGVIHRPRVLFLDEPTVGLDPQSRATIWDEVRRLRAEGMTIFLTTHYLDEADALCDQVAIIDHGRIVAEGTPDCLKREVAGDVVTIGLPGDTQRATKVLEHQPYVRALESPTEQRVRLYVDAGSTAIPHILRALDAEGIALDSIELHRPSLDDVFLARTGRSLRES